MSDYERLEDLDLDAPETGLHQVLLTPEQAEQWKLRLEEKAEGEQAGE